MIDTEYIKPKKCFHLKKKRFIIKFEYEMAINVSRIKIEATELCASVEIKKKLAELGKTINIKRFEMFTILARYGMSSENM